ncbi:MAG: ribonuclease R [Saprospiraceae bacterium]|nr:ribonuclease R [Saprospiraceae bacterium]
MRSKKNFKSKKLTKEELEKASLNLFKKSPKKRFKPTRIAKALRIKNSKDSILDVLKYLEKSGKIRHVVDELYTLEGVSSKNGNDSFIKQQYITGRVDMIKSGSAYIVSERDVPDIYVPKKHLKTALHDDEVIVELHHRRGARKQEGKVVEVKTRAHKKFVGVYDRIGGYGVVEATVRNNSIKIEVVGSHEAQNGDRVIIKIVHYGRNGIVKGEIEKILSSGKGHDLEMTTILINEGFDIAFSDEVLNETAQMHDKITEEDLAIRKDMRKILTFTIDPADAKDFDDAISYRILENGNEEIGVHIADVSHFVKEGSALDKEALARSTSVYLVDRVCPMLPERLSNELCSLRPNEDKFTFSAIFEFDNRGNVLNRWLGRTLTHSDKRFTYEEAQEILDIKHGPYLNELGRVDQISKMLREKRYNNGSIKFESDELRFTLDEDGKPEGVYVKERKDTHLLVEDLMLLANKEVATFISKKEKNTKTIPFIYRIHDQPDPDKLADFALLAADFGLKFNLNTPKEIANSFNNISTKIENVDHLRMLMPLAIRTMAKAEYSSDNIGHYGLGFSHYSHFTSPIRRYADLLVHRILDKNLKETYRVNGPALEQQCKHISRQERKAINAERESVKYMQTVYMHDRIGERFEATVSGVIEKGMFVETLESKAEGLIPFSDIGILKSLTSSSAHLKTPEGEIIYRFGDKLKVVLDGVDIAKRQINFLLSTDED